MRILTLPILRRRPVSFDFRRSLSEVNQFLSFYRLPQVRTPKSKALLRISSRIELLPFPPVHNEKLAALRYELLLREP